MKRTAVALCAAAFALAVPVSAQRTPAQPAPGPRMLTLMTYNVRNAKGMDGVCDYGRIASAIRAANPDVVAVQEVDSMTVRSGRRYVLGEIAERTGLKPFFAPAIDYDGGKYGIGLLARTQPLRVTATPLPGREERRALIVAEFPDYIFCSTHLSLTEADRMATLPIIADVVRGTDKPLFLAGDMNAHPGSPFIQALSRDFRLLSDTAKRTYPADRPDETLDYIAVLGRSAEPYAVQARRVADEPLASDHRPVVVRLRLALCPDELFRTAPYLQNPAEDAMTVMWQTALPTRAWVEYGTDTLHLQRARVLLDGQEDCDRTIHKIRLTGLRPGERYHYRVCAQEILRYAAYSKTFGHTARSPFSTFTTRRTDTDSFTAFVFNDLHQHADTYRALCKQLAGHRPDFVVFNGDCVDDPANRDQVTRIIATLTEGVGGDSVPTLFMRGNHEIRNAYSVGLRDHYDNIGGKTYGAFSWGDTRFVLLDCGEDKPDSHPVYYGMNDFSQLRRDQAAFLKTELSSRAFKRARKRVLIHHIPLYGNDGRNLCDSLWLPLLAGAPFDVCLNAHTHRYAYHPAGSELGNRYPVIIGGGYTMDGATAMLLEKKGKALRLRVFNTAGQKLLDLDL